MNNDIRLKFDFVDRAGRSVYFVQRRQTCECCGAKFWKSTGQKIRFDLDNNHHIRVDAMMIEPGAPDT